MATKTVAPAKQPRALPRSKAAKRTNPEKAPKPVSQWARWRAAPCAMGELCDFIASNGTNGHLAAFCRQHGFLYTTVRAWIESSEDRTAMYARAREDRADTLADEIVAISDEVEVSTRHDGEDVRLALDATAVARNRLRVDARKWAAAKLKPRAYGEKVQHGGDPDGVPIQHNMAVRFVESGQQ